VGLIGLVKSFARALRRDANVSDVQVDPGGGPVVTAEHFADPGDDSFPLNTDYCAGVPSTRQGNVMAVGYLDPINAPKALKGDKRIYARDPVTRLSIVEAWLHNDGSAEITNANGFFKLQADGTVNINGVTIDPTGAVAIPTSLTVAGKQIAGHNHDINSGSSAPGPTGGNN
jgi:hypothetical protein